MIRPQVVIPLLCAAAFLALVLFGLPIEDLPKESCPLTLDYNTEESLPLPDFASVRDIRRRKVEFFEYLMPMVQFENRRLAGIRQRLFYIQEHIHNHRELNTQDLAFVEGVLIEFRLADKNLPEAKLWQMIFQRVDEIPEALVLVQAANESAWGTSRFANEGNNLFGQWCFVPGCGMVPEGRAEGDTHEVALFDSVPHSVAAYMRNLNSGFAYDELRDIRALLRKGGSPISAARLAVGLTRYSQRGDDYVAELLAMLRVNTPIIDKIRSPGPDKPEA